MSHHAKPIRIVDAIAAQDAKHAGPELVRRLTQQQENLAHLPLDCELTVRAQAQLEVAETLNALRRFDEAHALAKQAFALAMADEAWDEAAMACLAIYRADRLDAIVALGNGLWLAVAFPIEPMVSIELLHQVIEETPDNSDGAAVAAAAAHYIAHLRAKQHERDNLTFLTAQKLAEVARRHRGIEGQAALDLWIEGLELNVPEVFIPRMSKVVDLIVGGQWWYDRDALRARLPVH